MGRRRAEKSCDNYNRTGEGEVFEYCRICKHTLRTLITSSANCMHFLCRNCYLKNDRSCSQCTCEREQEMIRIKNMEDALKQAAEDKEKELARNNKTLDEDAETKSQGIATNEANSTASTINPKQTKSLGKMAKGKDSASTSRRGQANNQEKVLQMKNYLPNSEPSVAPTSTEVSAMTESSQCVTAQSKQNFSAENGPKSEETGVPAPYADGLMESSIVSAKRKKHRRNKNILKKIQKKLIIRIRISIKRGITKYKIVKHRRGTKNHNDRKRKRSSTEKETSSTTSTSSKIPKLEGAIKKEKSDKTHTKSETKEEKSPKSKRFKATLEEPEPEMPTLERFDAVNVIPHKEGIEYFEDEKHNKGFAHYGTICVRLTDYKENKLNSHWEKISKTVTSGEGKGGNEKNSKKMDVSATLVMSENFEIIKLTKGMTLIPRKIEGGEPKYGTVVFHYTEVLNKVLQPSEIVLKIQDSYLKVKKSGEIKKVMLAEVENSESVVGSSINITKENKNDVAESGSIYKNFNLAMEMARIMSRLKTSPNGEHFSYWDDESNPIVVKMCHSHFCPDCNMKKQQTLPASEGWIQPGLIPGSTTAFQTKPEMGQPQGTENNMFLSLHILADAAALLQLAEQTSNQKIAELNQIEGEVIPVEDSYVAQACI